MKKYGGWNEVQIQKILKKKPQKLIPIKVLGADAKGVPSKLIAMHNSYDGERPE